MCARPRAMTGVFPFVEAFTGGGEEGQSDRARVKTKLRHDQAGAMGWCAGVVHEFGKYRAELRDERIDLGRCTRMSDLERGHV
jgi:hypothetical protein